MRFRRQRARQDLSRVPVDALAGELTARGFLVIPGGVVDAVLQKLERRDREVKSWTTFGNGLLAQADRLWLEADLLGEELAGPAIRQLEELE